MKLCARVVIASALCLSATACSIPVADATAFTPTLPKGTVATADATVSGTLASENHRGNVCFILKTEAGTVHLIASAGAFAYPNGNNLIGVPGSRDGGGGISINESVSVSGEWVSGSTYDQLRSRCPHEDEYFAVARVTEG